MKRNLLRRLAALGTALVCASLCASCASRSTTPSAGKVAATLPPAVSPWSAPAGVEGMATEKTINLYLPSRDGTRLITRPMTLATDRGESAVRLETLALLTAPGDDDTMSLGRGLTSLSLYGQHPVELSAGVCTVNLGSQALSLDAKTLYSVAHAITSTLSAAEEIRQVNMLVADQAVSYDLAGNLPAGSLSARPGEELSALWDAVEAKRTPLGEDPAEVPLSCVATLYFPLTSDEGYMPETRNLTFPGQTPQQLAQTLLSALFAGAYYIDQTADLSSLAVTLRGVDVTELPEGGRLITLTFSDMLEDALISIGVDMYSFCASVVYTLTTFIPSVGAVRMISGNTMTTMVQSEAAGAIAFQDGLMRRRYFSSGLRDQANIYLRRGNQLCEVIRAVPAGSTHHASVLMAQLLAGPTAAEAAEGMEAPLPQGLTVEDMVGVSAVEDTLLLALSPRFELKLRQAGSEYEQCACYAMVLTMCEALGATRIRFYFDGDTREKIGGLLYWGGEFLLDRVMVEDHRG